MSDKIVRENPEAYENLKARVSARMTVSEEILERVMRELRISRTEALAFTDWLGEKVNASLEQMEKRGEIESRISPETGKKEYRWIGKKKESLPEKGLWV